MSDIFWEHQYTTDDPHLQTALDDRRNEVLAATGRMPTWSEDVQFAVGFMRGRDAHHGHPITRGID